MHAKTVLGERKGVPIREVSLFKGLRIACKNCSWGKKSRPY